MAEHRRSRRSMVERSPSGSPVMRMEGVLLSRGDRGTWRLDLRIPSAEGDRYLQIPIGKHRAIDRLAWELRGGDDAS